MALFSTQNTTKFQLQIRSFPAPFASFTAANLYSKISGTAHREPITAAAIHVGNWFEYTIFHCLEGSQEKRLLFRLSTRQFLKIAAS